MGGWLDLAQQGLSPCKKYRASWRSSAKSYQIIELVHLLYLFNLKENNNCLRKWDVAYLFYLFFSRSRHNASEGNLGRVK
jgi:hypothetical protein